MAGAAPPTSICLARGSLCAINLSPLQGYVKQPLLALLAQARVQVSQPVKLSGIVDNAAIAYLERVAASRSVPLESFEGSAAHPTPVGVPTARERANQVERLLGERFPLSHPVEPTVRRSVWSRVFNIGHALFGSEDVTDLWSQQARLYALHSRRWLDDPDALVLHRIDRDEATHGYRAEISLARQDPIGHWLEIVDYTGEAYGCILPADQFEAPRSDVFPSRRSVHSLCRLPTACRADRVPWPVR